MKTSSVKISSLFILLLLPTCSFARSFALTTHIILIDHPRCVCHMSRAKAKTRGSLVFNRYVGPFFLKFFLFVLGVCVLRKQFLIQCAQIILCWHSIGTCMDICLAILPRFCTSNQYNWCHCNFRRPPELSVCWPPLCEDVFIPSSASPCSCSSSSEISPPLRQWLSFRGVGVWGRSAPDRFDLIQNATDREILQLVLRSVGWMID